MKSNRFRIFLTVSAFVFCLAMPLYADDAVDVNTENKTENTVKPNKTDEIEERAHNKEEKDNTFIIMVSVIVTITVMSIILVLVKSRSRQA